MAEVSKDRPPMNWPTAVVLVALFAMMTGIVWAIAYAVAS